MSGGGEDPPPQEPVLICDGTTFQFRLEAMFGDRPQFKPEALIGQAVAIHDTPLGSFQGVVTSVEPYVDARLGPGHWVTLG